MSSCSWEGPRQGRPPGGSDQTQPFRVLCCGCSQREWARSLLSSLSPSLASVAHHSSPSSHPARLPSHSPIAIQIFPSEWKFETNALFAHCFPRLARAPVANLRRSGFVQFVLCWRCERRGDKLRQSAGKGRGKMSAMALGQAVAGTSSLLSKAGLLDAASGLRRCKADCVRLAAFTVPLRMEQRLKLG